MEIKCQLDATEVFICRSYCLLNMFRASLCPSSGAQEYYTVVPACGISCCKNVKNSTKTYKIIFYIILLHYYRPKHVVSLLEYNIFLTSCLDWLHFPPSHNVATVLPQTMLTNCNSSLARQHTVNQYFFLFYRVYIVHCLSH